MIGWSQSREQKTSIIPPFRLIYGKTQLHVMHLSLSLQIIIIPASGRLEANRVSH
jgi:hypothetical protein